MLFHVLHEYVPAYDNYWVSCYVTLLKNTFLGRDQFQFSCDFLLGERSSRYARYTEEDEEKSCRVWGYNTGSKGTYTSLTTTKLMYKFYQFIIVK